MKGDSEGQISYTKASLDVISWQHLAAHRTTQPFTIQLATSSLHSKMSVTPSTGSTFEIDTDLKQLWSKVAETEVDLECPTGKTLSKEAFSFTRTAKGNGTLRTEGNPAGVPRDFYLDVTLTTKKDIDLRYGPDSARFSIPEKTRDAYLDLLLKDEVNKTVFNVPGRSATQSLFSTSSKRLPRPSFSKPLCKRSDTACSLDTYKSLGSQQKQHPRGSKNVFLEIKLWADCRKPRSYEIENSKRGKDSQV